MFLQTYLRLSTRHVISAQVSTTSQRSIIIIIYKPYNSKLSLNKQDNDIMVNVLMKWCYYRKMPIFFCYMFAFAMYGQKFRTFDLSIYIF